MDVHGSRLLFLTVLYITLAEVWSRHGEQRNLFALRACCRRQSHFVYIGQDISGTPVSVDVGLCRSHCGGASRAPSDGPQQEHLKHSSMLEFLRSKKMGGARRPSPERAERPSERSASPCGESHVCLPTGVRVDRVLLFEGPREVDVIQECQCDTKITQCVRTPALRTYFFETPYEAVVDVGGCSKAKDGFSCVPTKFESALVETPNKVDLIQTVVACDLKESCYRVPYVEYYYQIVDQADGIKEEKLKEVDVGRCLGGCTAGNRCLLRSSSDPETCHLWAERPQTSCGPQSYESHTFLNQHGQMRTVHSITSCHCQS
ncbi:hypothetical protein NHX12_004087 [Muraenolepis orangiensis]|uniref:Im:7138239 n=1 Tax=Muraenolepis orangiensis TaxID=630683 RepID=A0A9Q0DTS8_9TELE|nr:hypothetical protein NHX12_004087 [Muraenolepis orangiensis]